MTTPPRAIRALRASVPLAAACALSALILAPSTAFAETPATPSVSAVYAGPGVGYNKVLNGHAAGTVELKVDGTDTVQAFCVQYAKDMTTTGTYVSSTAAAAGIANASKAADIAIRHASIGTALADPKSEAAAAQLAIWHYTDNADFSAVPNASIVARASALVAAAGSHAEGPSSFVLTSSATVTGTGTSAKDVITVTVKTAEGTPLSGEKVTVGKAAATTTDAAGQVTVTVPAAAAAVTETVTLSADLPAGTILVPAGSQAMITTADATVTKTGTVTLPAAPAAPKPTPTPTSAAPHTPAPVQTPSTVVDHTPAAAPKTGPSQAPTPKELPYTGSWVQPWMFAVAAALGLGGLVARRRFRRIR